MKKILVALFLFTLIGLTGCAGAGQRMGQVFQKELNGGYPAIIRLYSLDGKLLQTWEGAHVLADSDDEGDPSLTFIMDGKKISISGVYSIQEK